MTDQITIGPGLHLYANDDGSFTLDRTEGLGIDLSPDEAHRLCWALLMALGTLGTMDTDLDNHKPAQDWNAS